MPRLILVLAFLAAGSAAVPQSVARPRILGVAHIALRVSDVEQSRAFYKDFLGFGEPYQLDNPDGSLSLTFIKVNDHQYIELFPGLLPEQDRLHHISLYVEDAEAMRAYLASRGVRVPDRVTRARIGTSNFGVTDPDGHTVEIVQYQPESFAVRETGRFMTDARISTRMLHAGIIAGHLAKSEAFYGDVLGFRELWRGAPATSKTLAWVNLAVPDGTDYIELMLYGTEPAPDRRGVVHHLCLEVEDAARAVERLTARPYRQKYTQPIEIRTGVNRKRQVNLFDPDGTRVELMEARTVDGVPAPASSLPPPGAQ
jgi:catechol 2,3-dioxygenase-like lactoylglutathione lyase family enzyme